jgi:hypothetical protein
MSLQGKRELQRRLKAIADTSEMLRGIQLETIAGAKARVPRKTGHLGRSIVPGAVSDTSALVEARTPYAAAVEFGSKPHVIKPKRASVLAWPGSAKNRRLSGRARTGTGRGDMVFAKSVRHPGTKPHPYLIPAALAAAKKRGVELIVERWNKAA